MSPLDTSLPPAMFDIDGTGDLIPPVFESADHGVRLTPYGAHEGLGPDVWDDFPSICGAARPGSIIAAGQQVRIWHVCSSTAPDRRTHRCDRCGETW